MRPSLIDLFDDLITDMLSYTGCGCCSDWDKVDKLRKKLLKKIVTLNVDDVCEVDDES